MLVFDATPIRAAVQADQPCTNTYRLRRGNSNSPPSEIQAGVLLQNASGLEHCRQSVCHGKQRCLQYYALPGWGLFNRLWGLTLVR